MAPNHEDIRSYETSEIITEREVMHAKEDEGAGCLERFYPSGFKRELKALSVLAVPAILTQLFQYLTGPIALMFCGHLGEEELASVALALAFTNVVGITVANGIATACDTLFSQVYGGKSKKTLGIILQKSLIILCLCVVPCWALHLNMEAILRLIGQEPVVARNAGKYMLLFMPGALAFFIYIGLLKYLQNQNIVIPNIIIGAVVNGINALLHYLFLYVWNFGFEGSAVALSISYFAMLILTLLYILVSKVYVNTWDGWSVRCLDDWGEFMRLGLSGLIMTGIEHCAFELGIILAGLLGTDYLGAMSVIFQIETTFYVIPQGVGLAASIRVGQYLGAGDAISAKTVARVAISAICTLALVVATLFLTLRNYLPLMFTDVPSENTDLTGNSPVLRGTNGLVSVHQGVISITSSVIPLVALFQISDGLVGTGGGILRGQGRQRLGAIFNVIGYGIGVGAGAPLMLYTSLQLYAFWGGLGLGVTLTGVVFVIAINKTDWHREASLAESRTEENVGQQDVLDVEREPLLKGDLEKNDLNYGGRPSLSKSTFKLVSTKEHLSTKSLLLRRGFILLSTLLILVSGIIVRFTYTNKLELPLGDALYINSTELYQVEG